MFSSALFGHRSITLRVYMISAPVSVSQGFCSVTIEIEISFIHICRCAADGPDSGNHNLRSGMR